jgi:hypothetical protein
MMRWCIRQGVERYDGYPASWVSESNHEATADRHPSAACCSHVGDGVVRGIGVLQYCSYTCVSMYSVQPSWKPQDLVGFDMAEGGNSADD